MRTRLLIALLAGVLTGCAQAPRPAPPIVQSPESVVAELLEEERRFATASATVPLVDGISAMFDDAVIMPAPPGRFATGKAEAVAALKANPSNAAAHAEWTPVRAGVSADGLHGFTYGFMTIREAGKPDRRAKYLSYWVKRPAGWRVVAYKRAGSAPGAVSTAMRQPALPSRIVRPSDAATAAAHRNSVAAAERAFAARAQVIGLGPAFAQFGSADAMNMGSASDFTFGNAAIAGGMPPGTDSPVDWAPDGGSLAASSGDLGMTWGFIRSKQPPSPGQPPATPFFTVWRRPAPDQPWLYIAE